MSGFGKSNSFEVSGLQMDGVALMGSPQAQMTMAAPAPVAPQPTQTLGMGMR